MWEIILMTSICRNTSTLYNGEQLQYTYLYLGLFVVGTAVHIVLSATQGTCCVVVDLHTRRYSLVAERRCEMMHQNGEIESELKRCNLDGGKQCEIKSLTESEGVGA